MDDFHKVSVDNEVYMYVREHATPDRKDFNSAIRQILFKKKNTN